MDKKTGIILGLIGAVIVLIMVAMYIPVRVQTGERITCSICKGTIKDTVKEIKIPAKDKKKYKITETSEMCKKCGNEIIKVQTGTITKCENCSKTIRNNVRTISVKRKEANKYSVSSIKKGLCSKLCFITKKYGVSVGMTRDQVHGILGHGAKGDPWFGDFEAYDSKDSDGSYMILFIYYNSEDRICKISF